MARIRVNSSLGTFQKNQDQLSNLSSCQQVAPKPKWLKVPWRGPPPLQSAASLSPSGGAWQLQRPGLARPVGQGSPTPGTGLRPVRNQAAQLEVSGGLVSEASLAAPHRSPFLHYLLNHRSHYCVNHPPHRSHYRLNHHLHPRSMEELSSTKPVPGTKKVGDHCCGEQRRTHTLEPSAG